MLRLITKAATPAGATLSFHLLRQLSYFPSDFYDIVAMDEELFRKLADLTARRFPRDILHGYPEETVGLIGE